MKRLLGLLLAAVVACGPSPGARDARPSGELVVVIRQGPERVPFRPDVARIKAANEQLAELLGHSIAIELDGSILPQTHEGAAEVIADLVQTVTRDVHGLEREHGHVEILAYTRAHFQRLVVRYDPLEASRRELRNREQEARLDPATGTVEVVLGEATPSAVARGMIASVFARTVRASAQARYARTLPADLPASEHRAWLSFHTTAKLVAAEGEHQVDVFGVRGALQLVKSSDEQLAREARAWLFDVALDRLRGAYQQHLPSITAEPPSSPFAIAERELVAWLNDEQAAMSLQERGKVAASIWLVDFRGADPSRIADRPFPGFDRLSFSFTTIDLWIAAGHPEKPSELHEFVEPVKVVWNNGHVTFAGPTSTGSSPALFFRWLFADAGRMDVLARAVQHRADDLFTATAFHQASERLDRPGYLRFLRGFERFPDQWKIGAYIIHQSSQRAPLETFEEGRRLWRDVPFARGYALFWFLQRGRVASFSERDWQDAVAGHETDDSDYAAYLDIGVPAIEGLPEIWPALPRHGRVRALVGRIDVLLDRDPTIADKVAPTFASIARKLCVEGSPEITELHAWAVAQRAKRPGAGFAPVAEESSCKVAPRRPTSPKPVTRSPATFDPWKK